MSIENVSGVKPVLAQAPKKEEVEQKVAQAQKEIKDGKKKLALTLGGLATLGVVTAGVIYGIKTGKFGKGKQEVQEQGQKAVEKIKGLVKGDDIPFESGKIEKIKIGDDDAIKETFRKYGATFNGQDVVVEEKMVIAPNSAQTGTFAFIRDKETGKLITAKKINAGSGKEIPMVKLRKSQGIHKTSKQLIDNAGNQVQKTFKNGKLYSTQTTILNPDGSKRIVIDYAYGKESPIIVQTLTGTEVCKPKGQTIIDIAVDGTRTVVQKAKNAFEM